MSRGRIIIARCEVCCWCHSEVLDLVHAGSIPALAAVSSEQMAAAEAAHLRKSNAIYFKLGDIKDKVRELVAVRLTKPGSNDEQRVWDELMELVNDG